MGQCQAGIAKNLSLDGTEGVQCENQSEPEGLRWISVDGGRVFSPIFYCSAHGQLFDLSEIEKVSGTIETLREH